MMLLPRDVRRAAAKHLSPPFYKQFRAEAQVSVTERDRHERKLLKEAGLDVAFPRAWATRDGQAIELRVRDEHAQRLFEIYGRLLKEQYDECESHRESATGGAPEGC